MSHSQQTQLTIVVMFVVVFPVATLSLFYFVHRFVPVRGRFILAGISYPVSTVGFAWLIYRMRGVSGGTLAAGMFFALWLGATLVIFFTWRQAYARALHDEELKQSLPPGKPRPFFWLGWLILTPVVIMAAVAATAIIKDRSTVEHEARQRAEEILAQVNPGFGRLAGFHLSDFENFGVRRWNDEAIAKSLWPGSPIRKYFETNWFPSSIELADAGSARYADAMAQAIKYPPTFNEEGRLIFRVGGETPRPPEWRMTLSAPQLAAWDSFVSAVVATNRVADVATAAHDFLATDPPGAARVNAEFLQLQSRLTTVPPAEGLQDALDFCARRGPRLDPLRPGELAFMGLSTESESGIPVTSLTMAEALRLASRNRLSESLWQQLVCVVIKEPNFFTPVLLQLAEPLTTNDPALAECLGAMRVRCREIQRSSDMADTILSSSLLHGVTLTNCWIDFEGSHWFCILEPRVSVMHTNRLEITNHFTGSRLFPPKAVAMAFSQAFKETKLAIPKYFTLAAALEGSAPFLIDPDSRTVASPSGAILAQADGVVTEPGGMAGSDQRFETFPSRPHYELRIYLADRSLMFAAQRQRAFTFGGLILASALAALIGFLTARRAFYRQLRLNEMKSDFVSSVSHELRAPIASVRLMAEGLERGRIAEPEKQREYFKFIVQECRRLSSLIENVLDFSRIEQGRKQYEPESTDLAALTQQTVKVMETYAAERDVSISLSVTGEPVPVNADGKAMQQALVNLIDNALKHSPKGGEVTVGLDFTLQRIPVGVQPSGCPQMNEPQPSHVQLWVEDHGEGIAESEHEKIFERFYRVGSELRRETQGVGIGLSIVQHIVEAHNGRVTVRSAPGQGSRFTIELPVGNGA